MLQKLINEMKNEIFLGPISKRVSDKAITIQTYLVL